MNHHEPPKNKHSPAHLQEFPDPQTLFELAQHHPEQLESLRHRWIEHVIQSAPRQRQQRLRGLQFQIDAIRRGSKNPVHICVRLNTMMMTSLHQLHNAVQSSIHHQPSLNHQPSQQPPSSPPAKVKLLPFAPKAAGDRSDAPSLKPQSLKPQS